MVLATRQMFWLKVKVVDLHEQGDPGLQHYPKSQLVAYIEITFELI
jgi:hypothetical protein